MRQIPETELQQLLLGIASDPTERGIDVQESSGGWVGLDCAHRCELEERAETLLAFSQCLFCLLALGEVTPDRLDLLDVALHVENGVRDPLLPAAAAIGQYHLVLIADYLRVRQEALDPGPGTCGGRGGDQSGEFRTDELLARFAEVATVCTVDKR